MNRPPKTPVPAAVNNYRRKFIVVTMAALVVTLTIICIAIFCFFSISNMNRSDSIIDTLHENGGSFPQADSVREPSMDPTFLVNPETTYENRWAWATIDITGSISEINSNHIATFNEDEVREAVEEAWRSGKERGYQGYYRYGVFENNDGSGMVIILDCYQRQQSALIVLRISIVVSLTCAAMVLLILIPFSRRITRPFARGVERQQRFITDASHELKTPLAIIAANTELTEQISGETQWTRSTKAQVERLMALVSDLIDMARDAETSDTASLPSFDVSELVDRAVQDFYPLAEIKGKTIQAAIARDVKMKGDPQAIERLVGLLLNNAITHGDEGCRIDISLAGSRRKVVLRTSNLAKDLTEKEASFLCDRFYRSDSSRSRSTGGYGIGLSVARSIAEQHNGKLVVAKEGDLVVFTVTLPRSLL